MVASKLKLQHRYDSTAEIYDRRYGEIQHKKYEAVLADVPRTDCILDLGCGTGMLLDELAKRSRFVVGIDISTKMLKIAQRRNNATIVRADADRLPFIDRSFDTVVSVTLLQNMPNPAATIKEISRVLKPGGTIVVTTLKHKHCPDQLTRWTTAVGLKPLKVGEIPNSEDIICVARQEA